MTPGPPRRGRGASSSAFRGPAAALLLAAQPNFMRDIVRWPASCRWWCSSTPRCPATTIPALIAHAKANPGRSTGVGWGTGSAPHIAGLDLTATLR